MIFQPLGTWPFRSTVKKKSKNRFVKRKARGLHRKRKQRKRKRKKKSDNISIFSSKCKYSNSSDQSLIDYDKLCNFFKKISNYSIPLNSNETMTIFSKSHANEFPESSEWNTIQSKRKIRETKTIIEENRIIFEFLKNLTLNNQFDESIHVDNIIRSLNKSKSEIFIKIENSTIGIENEAILSQFSNTCKILLQIIDDIKAIVMVEKFEIFMENKMNNKVFISISRIKIQNAIQKTVDSLIVKLRNSSFIERFNKLSSLSRYNSFNRSNLFVHLSEQNIESFISILLKLLEKLHNHEYNYDSYAFISISTHVLNSVLDIVNDIQKKIIINDTKNVSSSSCKREIAWKHRNGQR